MSYTPHRIKRQPVMYKAAFARRGGFCVYCGDHAMHEVLVQGTTLVRLCRSNTCKAKFWTDDAY